MLSILDYIIETYHDQNIVLFDFHQTLYWEMFYGQVIASQSILVKPYHEDVFFLWILIDSIIVSLDLLSYLHMK